MLTLREREPYSCRVRISRANQPVKRDAEAEAFDFDVECYETPLTQDGTTLVKLSTRSFAERDLPIVKRSIIRNKVANRGSRGHVFTREDFDWRTLDTVIRICGRNCSVGSQRARHR